MFSIPRNPAGLVVYAFRALGKAQVPLQRLVYFLSFDIRQMAPSKARKLIDRLHSEGQLFVEDGQVKLAPEVTIKPEVIQQAQTATLGEYLRSFVSSARLSRAVGMSDAAVECTRLSQDPLKIEATIHGSRDYNLILDEANNRIAHDCPDWQRVSVLHRFCKHVAKLFLLLENEEAIRILRSLQEESWDFERL
jgi:hypothetical protein